jgi:hypothetical protein
MRSREAPPRLIVAATFHLGKDDTSAHETTWYSQRRLCFVGITILYIQPTRSELAMKDTSSIGHVQFPFTLHELLVSSFSTGCHLVSSSLVETRYMYPAGL